MPRIEETIPAALAAEAEAARAWFSQERGSDFKLTGIVDPDDIGKRGSAAAARELQLILCGSQAGQEVCLLERFELSPVESCSQQIPERTDVLMDGFVLARGLQANGSDEILGNLFDRCGDR